MEPAKGIQVASRGLGAEKLEDLEITSVGAIYHGPWDKKYWSSSRGKDRHPYPVGYSAVRTHMGSTHRMEVREGPKGPLFLVTASDGFSAAGQTPDIAWGNYQKKSGSVAKNRNEKRFSSKIDGAEFFGFRNPFVLRLLRELMADMNGVAGKDLLSSNISNDSAELNKKTVNQHSHELTNLLAYLEKQPSTRKRSTRYKTSAKDLDKEARRKVRLKFVQVDTKVHAPEQVGMLTEDATVSPRYMDYQSDGIKKKDMKLFSKKDPSVADGCCHPIPPGDKSHVEMEDTDEFIEKYVISDDKNKSGGHEHSLASYTGIQIPDTENQSELLIVAKDSDEEIPDLGKCPEALVPDTCDTVKHDLESFTSTSCQGNPSNMITNNFSIPENLFLQDDTTLKGLINDSIPEDASTSGCSDPNSQNPDLAVQELTKYMMTFLLPRAVPLVKKTYVKRRSRYRKQGEASRPCLPLARVGSVEHEVEPKYLANDKVEAGILMHESQSRGHVDVNETQTFGAECQLTKMVHSSVSIDDTICKPCDGETGSKGQSSIPPDNFEDDKYMDGVSLKGPLTISYECDIIPSAEIREKINTPTPVISEANISKEPLDSICGDNECNITTQSKNLEYNEYLLSDSLIACLEEEFNNEFAGEENVAHAVSSYDAKCINHMAQLTSNLVNKDPRAISTDYICDDTEEKAVLHHDHFEQDLPKPGPYTNALEERVICKAVVEKNHDIHGNPEFESLSHDDPSQFQLHNALEHENGKPVQMDATHVSQEAINDKAVITRDRVSIPVFHIPNAVVPPEQQMPHSSTVRLVHKPYSFERNHIPLSESIICRNFEDVNDNELSFAPNSSELIQNNQGKSAKCDVNMSRNMASSKSIDVHVPMSSRYNHQHELHESFKQSSTPFRDCNQPSKNIGTLSYPDKKSPIKATFDNRCTYPLHVQLQQKQVSHGSLNGASDNELEGTMELVGSYLHPYPILHISLSSRDDSLWICVMCGSKESKSRYLFMYTLPMKEQKGICPTFIGHTEVVLPVSTRISDRHMPFERLGLQFTPDGDSLVILNSIKVPLCRQQKTNCSCSTCKLESYEANAIKIVQVKFGYVLPVAKLTTNVALCCVLVCEPNYLIALEESGRMHIWLMDCNWSESIEKFVLPSFDYFVPVELKRIPRSNILVVGHDGIGGFGLWDISKRSLVSRFSAPGHMIIQILPIGYFSLQDKEIVTALKEKDQTRETLLMVKNCFVKSSIDQLIGENIALWLLISATSNVEAEAEPDSCPVRWRLGLLAKNMVTMGSVLDNRASVVGVLADYHGVIGTYEGLLYRWELLTGKKLEVLHRLNSGSISCAATDAKSGSLAVADDSFRLLVFRQAQAEVRR